MSAINTIRTFLAATAVGLIVATSVAGAETRFSEDTAESRLGTLQIADTEVGLLIAYRPDAAILQLSIRGEGSSAQYLPLIVSTYRGIPPVDVDLYASDDDQEIWALSSLPGAKVLAHYRLGATTGLTAFGKTTLSDTAFPDFLSGGPLPFPVFDPQKVSKRATFYHRDALPQQ